MRIVQAEFLLCAFLRNDLVNIMDAENDRPRAVPLGGLTTDESDGFLQNQK